MAFIDKNNLAAAVFYYTYHSHLVCCAFCVAQVGLWQEGVMHLKNTNVTARLVGSLKVYLSGKSLLVLSTSLPHRLSSPHVATTCVGLVSGLDTIHIQKVVTILVCNSSFVNCTDFIAHH